MTHAMSTYTQSLYTHVLHAHIVHTKPIYIHVCTYTWMYMYVYAHWITFTLTCMPVWKDPRDLAEMSVRYNTCKPTPVFYARICVQRCVCGRAHSWFIAE